LGISEVTVFWIPDEGAGTWTRPYELGIARQRDA